MGGRGLRGDTHRRVLRHEVPVDDEWHGIALSGPILHIATRDPRKVEIWSLHNPDEQERVRVLRVFGTGHALSSDTAAHVGSTVTPDGMLVWHLFERSRNAVPNPTQCVASLHIPTTGATCSVCGATGMQHQEDHPGGGDRG